DLPIGRVLFARLQTRHENISYTSDSSFTAATVAIGRATFTSLATDTTEVYANQPFTWTAVPNAQAYYLYIGTTLGANDVVNTGEIQTTVYSPNALPANTTLYARLYTKVDGVWR